MSGGERVVWNTMKSELWFVNSCLRVENGQTVSTLPSARSGFNLDAVCRGEAALQRFREAVAPSPSAQEWLYQQGHVAGVQTANLVLGSHVQRHPALPVAATPPRSPLLIPDPRGFSLRSSSA